MATLSVGGTTVFDGSALQSGVTFPAGHVIQTVSNQVTASSTARTVNSFAKVVRASDSALVFTGQITNVGASNKVLAMMKVNTYTVQNDAADGGAICLYRGDDIIYSHPSGHANYHGSAPSGMGYYTDWQYCFLDTSPDTGTNNYYMGYRIYSNASIIVEGNQPFHIILQEIQG